MSADEELDFEEDGDEETPAKPGKPRKMILAQDRAQAEWLAQAFDGKVRYDHTAKRWHIWNGTRWAPDKTRQVQLQVMNMAHERLVEVASDASYSKTARDALEAKYRKLTDLAPAERALEVLGMMPGYATDGSDWDQNPYLLGCENGIVDLRENALVDKPAPEMLVTRSTGHDFVPFDPGTESIEHRVPILWKSLTQWTSGDEELALFYLLWFGYSLFGLAAEQRFLILIGTGRNGKGALVSTMRHVFGEYSASSDQNLYSRTKFGAARSDGARADLMELKGKRVAIMSEPESGAFNEEMLKAHTGGDPITARALYSNSVISWVPTHSITFLTNDLPKLNDIGPSMAARVMVADFRERYDGANEDKRLYKKLEAEAAGILSVLCWAGQLWYRAWQSESGGLSIPDRVMKASEAYLSANDPLGRALEEAFVVEQGAKAAARALYDAYTDWHAREGIEGEPLTNTAFGLMLVRRGFPKKQVRSGTVYTNIRPKTAMEVADDDGG